MNGLSERAIKGAKSRQPVRDAVGKCRSEIYDARVAGISWAVLHAQLASEGVNVGKGVSSLISAMKYWAKRDGVSLSAVRSAVSVQPAREVARDFSDTRFPASEWGQP